MKTNSLFFKYFEAEYGFKTLDTLKVKLTGPSEDANDPYEFVPTPGPKFDALKLSETKMVEYTRFYQRVFSNNYKILCGSFTPVGIGLWSYYAKGHEGICIQFDLNEDIFAQIGHQDLRFPVEYSNERGEPSPIILQGNTYSDGYLLTALKSISRRKALLWEHEEEHRIIFPRNGLEKVPTEDGRTILCRSFSWKSVKSVTFGFYCPEAWKSKILGIIKDSKHAVQLYEIRAEIRTFDLKRNRIN